MSFPLLTLPFVALKNVLKLTGVFEKFLLLKTSRKFRSLMKRTIFGPKSPILYFTAPGQLRINDGKEMRLEVRQTRETTVIQDFWSLPDFEKLPIFVTNETLHVIWDGDQKPLMTSLINYFMEIFENDLSLFVDIFTDLNYTIVYGPIVPVDILETLRILKKSFKIESLSIDGQIKGIENVLEECHNISKLNLDLKQAENFEFPAEKLNKIEPFHAKEVSISSANWLKIDDFLRIFMNSKTVSVQNSKFIDEDLVKIFEKWMGGVCVEHFYINYKGENIKSVMEKLMGAEPVGKAWIDEKVQEFPESTCYVIRNIHGTPSIVYHRNSTIYLSTNFHLKVDGMTADVIIPVQTPSWILELFRERGIELPLEI